MGTGDHYYNFNDGNVSSGNNLYRLRIVDKDGTYSYSPVKKLSNNLKNESQYVMVPNPAKNFIELISKNEDLLQKQGLILNSLGQTLQTFTITEQRQKINISELPAGIYQAKLPDGHSVLFSKFD